MSYFQYTTLNRNYINLSSECACIFCFRKFKPDAIIDFCEDIDINNDYFNKKN
jgi:hypothetical protein